MARGGREAGRSGRLGKWLVSGPPLLYLLVFFAVPTLIMALASFRTPGEFGGLAPLLDEAGALDLNVDSYARFLTEPVYAQVFLKSVWYALLTTLRASRSPIRWRRSSPEREAVPRSAAAPRDPAVLEQLPDPDLRLDDHPRAAGGAGAQRQRLLARLGAEPVSLLFSSFAVLVCLVYVHLPFMVLPLYANLEKHDQALLDAAQDLGANALAAVLADHVSAVAAGRLRRRGAGVHPGAGHIRDSRHSGRSRRQPDRQRDQAAVPGNARLALRQRALDRADRRGAGAGGTGGMGRPRQPRHAASARDARA